MTKCEPIIQKTYTIEEVTEILTVSLPNETADLIAELARSYMVNQQYAILKSESA